jgi:hypothetical protein
LTKPNYITVAAAGGGGQVVHQETRTGGSSGAASVASAALGAAAGHLYLAAISTKPRVAVNAVAGLGLSWTRVRAQCAARNQTGIELWMAIGTPSGGGVVSATLAAAPINATIAASRYSGVNAAAPIGSVVSGNTLGAGGACSGGTDSGSYSFALSTPSTGGMVYGAAAMRNRTHTPGAGYTERAEIAQGSSGDIASIAAEDRAVSSSSTIVNGAFSGLTDWAVIGVEIKP